MILSAIYNVLDGEELLEGSIRTIRPYVDEVIVVASTTSNNGTVTYQGGLEMAVELFHQGMVDKLMSWRPYPSQYQRPWKNETLQRGLGLMKASEMGCTHFLFMDCDEYYVADQFDAAKSFMEQHPDTQGSAVRLQTYVSPRSRLAKPEDYWVPFIHQIEGASHFHNASYPLWADPSRRVKYKSPSAIHAFSREMIEMHHYSWVRRDVNRKIAASVASKSFARIKDQNKWPSLSSTQHPYADEELVEVENIFDIAI